MRGRLKGKGATCNDSAELRTDSAMNVNVTHGCNCYQQFAQKDGNGERNVRKSFSVVFFSQVFYCIVSQSSYKLGISSGLLYRITNRRLPPHRRRRSRCWRRRSWCPTAPCSPSSSLFSPASSLFHGFAAPVLGHDLHDSSHCRWLKFSRPSVAPYSPHAVSWNRTRFLT